jgi:DNA-binding helix-hairpin-helix protein with protein kinase domain
MRIAHQPFDLSILWFDLLLAFRHPFQSHGDLPQFVSVCADRKFAGSAQYLPGVGQKPFPLPRYSLTAPGLKSDDALKPSGVSAQCPT